MSHKYLSVLLVILAIAGCNASENASSPQGKADQKITTPGLTSSDSNIPSKMDEQKNTTDANNDGRVGEK